MRRSETILSFRGSSEAVCAQVVEVEVECSSQAFPVGNQYAVGSVRVETLQCYWNWEASGAAGFRHFGNSALSLELIPFSVKRKPEASPDPADHSEPCHASVKFNSHSNPRSSIP